MELTESFNKVYEEDGSREFSRSEVDKKLLSVDKWNFNYKKWEVYKVFVCF